MSYTGKNIDLSKYDKYGKNVELSKVEVELASVQDIEKLISKYKGLPASMNLLSKTLDDLHTDFKKVKKQFEDTRTRAMALNSQDGDAFDIMGKLYNEIREKTKELGLSPSDIPNFKEFDSLWGQTVKATNKLKQSIEKSK